MKKIILLILIFATLACFSSCKDNPDGSVDFGDYILPSEADTTLSYDASQILNADTSWQKAYALSYSYFDTETGESTITEGKCGKYYQSIDSATKIITFLSQEDGFMMQYMLDSYTKTGTAAVVTDSTVEDAYSGFVMLSVCDPYFPVYKNVTKVGSDFVAERPATRYKQVETKDNVQTRIAYIWIDDELGFASKCELYNVKTQELLMRWELLDFTQNVTEEGIKINIDAYNITTE